MTNRYGVLLPHFGSHATRERIVEAAVALEDYGFDSLWVAETGQSVLTLECDLETVRGPIGRGKARATVGGELAVRGTLTFAVDRSS